MTLTSVRSALTRLGAATLAQLAAELSASPPDVDALLEFWERRGNVRRCATVLTTGCGTSCRRCPLGAAAEGAALSRAPDPVPRGAAPVVYEWVR